MQWDGSEANLLRFLNYSDASNVKWQKSTANENHSAGFYTSCDVKADVELTFARRLQPQQKVMRTTPSRPSITRPPITPRPHHLHTLRDSSSPPLRRRASHRGERKMPSWTAAANAAARTHPERPSENVACSTACVMSKPSASMPTRRGCAHEAHAA